MKTLDIGCNAALEKQLNFIIEVDKVKQIMRKSRLFDNSRYENDAEHSWTIALMACLLRDYADFEVDLEKLLIMLLIHDIVEVDAGDTFLYAAERANVHQAEAQAAQRIFGLLEDSQRDYFIGLWEEFELKETNEAKFAGVFDRLEPLLQNYLTEGFTWKKYGISYEMVVEKNKALAEASTEIWNFVLAMLEKAVQKNYLRREI